MSAVRVFQSMSSVFPWNKGNESDSPNDNVRQVKRRKTQTTGGRCTFNIGMRMESDLTYTSSSSSDTSEELMSDEDRVMDSTLPQYTHPSSSPSVTFSLAIQNRGIPCRLDPFSIDHFIYFEDSNSERPQAIPLELVSAMQHGDEQGVIEHLHQYGNSTHLSSLRTSDGETLLHVAAASGCHAVVERLLKFDLQLPTMVLDGKGRSPLHSLCMAMSHSHHPAIPQPQQIEIMRLVLRHSPTIILYMDQERMTPLEYLHSNHSQQISHLLLQENVVERVAQEMTRQMQKARSGQHMTAMETVDRMVNLSGIDAAIMETGLSI